jgi:hypothetical protein
MWRDMAQHLGAEIELEDYIEPNRWVFRSLAMGLRRRPQEIPAAAMEGASVVGYAEPNWLLLKHRGSFVLLNLDPEINKTRKGRPKWISPKTADGNFFFTLCSSSIVLLN